MQDSPLIIYITAGALSWMLVLYKLQTTWKQRLNDRRVLGSWFFIFCFALSITLKTEPIYLTVGRETGINNLALLLSYISVVIGMYWLVDVVHIGNEVGYPKIANILICVELLVLGLLFQEMMGLPNRADHTIPTSLGEYAFMLTLYLYTIAMATSPIKVFVRLLQGEQLLAARLRITLFLIAASTGLLLFASKTFFITVALIDPHYTQQAPLVFSLFIALTILALTIALMPNKFFVVIANKLEKTHKQRQLRDLQNLQTLLEPFCPPVVPISPEYSKNTTLDHQLYSSVIFILDARKTIEKVEGGKARKLYNALQVSAFTDSTDIESLITTCCQISHQVRERKFNE